MFTFLYLEWRDKIYNIFFFFSSTPPRTDSVLQLLLQGLNNREKKILESVLERADDELINNTVKRLPIEAIVPLLEELQHYIQVNFMKIIIKIKKKTKLKIVYGYETKGELLSHTLWLLCLFDGLLHEMCHCSLDLRIDHLNEVWSKMLLEILNLYFIAITRKSESPPPVDSRKQ